MNKRKGAQLVALCAALALTLASCSSVADVDGQGAPPTASPAPSNTGSAFPAQPVVPEPLPALKAAMAMEASIPSMCGFPKGKLKNGELSKKHPEHPDANPPRIPNREFVVAGDLTGDGVDELAAVIYCDKGGVPWPAQIQLFESTVDGIAALGQPFETGSINGGARGMPSSFKYANGRLSLGGPQLLMSDNATNGIFQVKRYHGELDSR